ncbi:MAG: YbaN family protein [Halioglobus sp.]|nr:YbaN family protein [Halioglobus sp.]
MKTSFYKPLGLFFLALGIAGVALPILPSTPFILLAAWFFARSSERWHRRLLDSELFGPMIRNWERERCISCRTKAVALVSMLIGGGASILFALEDYRFRLATGLLMAIGCATILWLNTCDTQTDKAQS